MPGRTMPQLQSTVTMFATFLSSTEQTDAQPDSRSRPACPERWCCPMASRRHRQAEARQGRVSMLRAALVHSGLGRRRERGVQEAQRQRAHEDRHQRDRQVALGVIEHRRDLIPDPHAGWRIGEGRATPAGRRFADALR